LNYTFQKVADQMGTKIDDPQFVTYIHNKLKEGAKAKDFGIVSTACGVGQFIRANVLAYYPEGFDGI
jgi:ribose 5-phosphate isomerase RpiB